MNNLRWNKSPRIFTGGIDIMWFSLNLLPFLYFRCKYEGVTAVDTRSEYDFDAGSDVEAWTFVPYYR